MEEIVAQVGTRNNCTFCGVFRRQALDRGAQLIRADKVHGVVEYLWTEALLSLNVSSMFDVSMD